MQSQSRLIESLIARTIASSISRHSALSIYFSRTKLQVFNNITLISQYSLPRGFTLQKQSDVNLESWIENVYPSGVQSPFSLALRHNQDICILTISLRGRVSTKCFYT